MEKVVSAINPQYQYIAKIYLHYPKSQWNSLNIGDLALNSLELTGILHKNPPQSRGELVYLIDGYDDWAVRCALNIARNLHYLYENSSNKREILAILSLDSSLMIDKDGFLT